MPAAADKYPRDVWFVDALPRERRVRSSKRDIFIPPDLTAIGG
jgi:hypothetical protein